MTKFKIHTAENAPEKSRRILKDVENKLGFVPNYVGEMAESPTVLRAWNELKSIAEDGLLSPVERRIVGMTAGFLNNSDYCLAAGATIAEKEGVAPEVIAALRADKPLKDVKLEQLRLFTRAVLKSLGRPDRKQVDAFIKAGYTNAHMLEVILGISSAMLGAYVNHIAETPLDRPFGQNRVEERKVTKRKSKAA